jgi:hypothetical protein
VNPGGVGNGSPGNGGSGGSGSAGSGGNGSGGSGSPGSGGGNTGGEIAIDGAGGFGPSRFPIRLPTPGIADATLEMSDVSGPNP